MRCLLGFSSFGSLLRQHFVPRGGTINRHGIIVYVLFTITSFLCVFSLNFLWRAASRCFPQLRWSLEPRTHKPVPWWQDIYVLGAFFILTPLALRLSRSSNVTSSCVGGFLAAYLLADALLYHIRVLWFDDLSRGTTGERFPVHSHRRILLVLLGNYFQSIFLFEALYRSFDGQAVTSGCDFALRSFFNATLLSPTNAFGVLDQAQVVVSIFFVTVAVSSMAAASYRRAEIASEDWSAETSVQEPTPIGSGRVRAVVLDFDGVLTDNAVIVSQDGSEMVRCNRSDGLALRDIINSGLAVLVLSSEENPVVAARCRKLGVDFLHGVKDKARALSEWLSSKGIALQDTVYVGNDTNDVACMTRVGYPVATADAWPEAKQVARVILTTRGGHGVVRELRDLLSSLSRNS